MIDQIFSGVKVLDLTWYIAGPYCTKMFADYGADVLKVERPIHGDPARMMPPFLNDEPHPEKSLLFSHLNLNKRSITLNLKNDQGLEIIKRLIREADILVENFSPGVIERLGLGYESCRKINPRLVMTSISNYGQTGPYRDYKLSELVLNGFHSMINNGEPNRHPVKKGGNVSLYQGGLMASLVTSAALWASEEQGRGEHIDISLMEVQAGDVDRKTVDMLAWAYSGHPIYTMRPEADEWQAKTIMPGGIYPCQDGFIASFPVLTHWPRFVKLMNDPEWEKLEYPDDILDTESETKGMIDIKWYDWLAKRTRRQTMEECQAAKFFVTAISTPKDAVEDPYFNERGFWVKAEHPLTGEQIYPGAPIEVGEGSWQVRYPAPLLGQHNQEVYQEQLGYTLSEIGDFKKSGII